MEIIQLIERINALHRKQKAEGLSPEEKEEQSKLRRIYIDNIKAQLVPQLKSIKVVDEDSPEYIEYQRRKQQEQEQGGTCPECGGHHHGHHHH